MLYDTLSSSDCACVCISCCVPCAAQIQCRNINVYCSRNRYVCTGNGLCMNIDVSVKAYFSSLHISPCYWSVIILSSHFVQNPSVLFSSAGHSSPIVLALVVPSSYPVSSQSVAMRLFSVVKHWMGLIEFKFSDKLDTKYNPPIVQRSLLLIALFWNSLLLALVSFLSVIVFSKASYGWLC